MNFSHIPLNNSTLSHCSINHYKTTGTDKLNTQSTILFLDSSAPRRCFQKAPARNFVCAVTAPWALRDHHPRAPQLPFLCRLLTLKVKKINWHDSKKSIEKDWKTFCCSAAAQPTPGAKNTVALHWALLREVWPRSRSWFSPWRSHRLSRFWNLETDVNPPSLKIHKKIQKATISTSARSPVWSSVDLSEDVVQLPWHGLHSDSSVDDYEKQKWTKHMF